MFKLLVDEMKKEICLWPISFEVGFKQAGKYPLLPEIVPDMTKSLPLKRLEAALKATILAFDKGK